MKFIIYLNDKEKLIVDFSRPYTYLYKQLKRYEGTSCIKVTNFSGGIEYTRLPKTFYEACISKIHLQNKDISFSCNSTGQQTATELSIELTNKDIAFYNDIIKVQPRHNRPEELLTFQQFIEIVSMTYNSTSETWSDRDLKGYKFFTGKFNKDNEAFIEITKFKYNQTSGYDTIHIIINHLPRRIEPKTIKKVNWTSSKNGAA